MVDDDEIAKAGKRVRVGDLPIMDRDDGGPFPRRDFDAVPLNRRAESSLLLRAKLGRHRAIDGMWKLAQKRTERQRRRSEADVSAGGRGR